MKHRVVLVEWLESERGWGVRPDGASLHLTNDDYETYVKEYWNKMPDEVPDEYSRPATSPKIIDVDDEIYNKIKRSKNGIRLWEHEYHEVKACKC